MALLFSSCSESDNNTTPSLNKTEVTLYVEETICLIYSDNDCIWTSDNPLIASVKNGIITANHVGETLIYANNSACKVTVKPRYTKYYEPYTEWSKGKKEIKQYMKNYEIREENTDNISYTGKNDILFYLYSFESGKLKASGFTTKLSESNYLLDFLLERYIPISSEGTTLIFSSIDKKTAVALKVTLNGLMVGYVPLEDQTKTSSIEIESIFAQINKQ